MRRIVIALVMLSGCVDSAMPQCIDVCHEAVSGPTDYWASCGVRDATCAPSGARPFACHLDDEPTCVCRFGPDGTVTALCGRPD
jgi:hypothetical protein